MKTFLVCTGSGIMEKHEVTPEDKVLGIKERIMNPDGTYKEIRIDNWNDSESRMNKININKMKKLKELEDRIEKLEKWVELAKGLMHPTQTKLLHLSEAQLNMSLRKIAPLVDQIHPYAVSFHLKQLCDMGHLKKEKDYYYKLKQ